LREIRRSNANIEFREVDLAGSPEESDAALWKTQGDRPLPWVVVRFPDAGPSFPPAWAGRLADLREKGLLDSPARREIVRRLLAGDSAVWVLLESGRQETDDAAAALLKDELNRLEKTLKLPVPAEEDPPLLSEVPLKIAFSILRISASDEGERAFAGLLRAAEPDLRDAEGPVVIPIFGRGRALWPIWDKGISREAIEEIGVFLTGECSCQVKELNPGVDLLFDVDWEGSLAMPVREEPPPPPTPVLGTRRPAGEPPPSAPPAQPFTSSRPLLWAGALVAGLLAVVTGRRLFGRAGS
ncbi:MAG: hypothetical protein ACK44W_15020, partial [Planctomycetota bacterium]